MPNTEDNRYGKTKFLLGVVLAVNGTDYYVPVTSFKAQQKDNFLIRVDNGAITSPCGSTICFQSQRKWFPCAGSIINVGARLTA